MSAEPYSQKRKIGNVLVCPECRSIVSRDALFCKFCGVYDVRESDVLYLCADCGETFRENFASCPACGAELSEGL